MRKLALCLTTSLFTNNPPNEACKQNRCYAFEIQDVAPKFLNKYEYLLSRLLINIFGSFYDTKPVIKKTSSFTYFQEDSVGNM